MPANWNLPTTTSHYATGVLQVIDERLKDAVSLFNTDGTNIPENSLKYNRASNKLQERIAGAWIDKVLALAGGGTGGATAADARTNLGLGTLAIQNANAVAITAGTIEGLTSLGVTGNATISGTVSGDGSLLTNLNATALATGLVGTARLGSGVASVSTFLRGDQTWATPLGTVPSGLIAMFDAACPSGWTRFSPLDNRFPRGATSYGATGGADTHSHGAVTGSGGSHTHGFSGTSQETTTNHTHGISSSPSLDVEAGSGVSVNSSDHNHGGATGNAGIPHTHGAGSYAVGSGGTHSHSIASDNNIPAYLNVVWCKKD